MFDRYDQEYTEEDYDDKEAEINDAKEELKELELERDKYDEDDYTLEDWDALPICRAIDAKEDEIKKLEDVLEIINQDLGNEDLYVTYGLSRGEF